MIEVIKKRFPPDTYWALLIDLEDRCRAEALKAFEMVRDHAGLDKKRGRELEGQARFRMMEKGFQEVCEVHGGELLTGGLIPNTNLKVFQPFMRFEHEGKGVILGLAAMPEPSGLPIKNKSRLAGVTLNYHLQPNLDLDGVGAQVGDVFIVFLISKDRERAGRLEEIAIGVISAAYDQFLCYEPLENYLGDQEVVTDGAAPTSAAADVPAVRLKASIRPFVPPEAPKETEAEESKK
ncbi:hypothetical protein ACM25O_16185 [Sulfitobacter pontiacus]